MRYVLTIIIGWLCLSLASDVIEMLLELTPGTIKNPFTYYVLIGYVVTLALNIPSPLNVGRTENSFFPHLGKINLKLFFLDIYYAVWWPYYLIRLLKK